MVSYLTLKLFAFQRCFRRFSQNSSSTCFFRCNNLINLKTWAIYSHRRPKKMPHFPTSQHPRSAFQSPPPPCGRRWAWEWQNIACMPGIDSQEGLGLNNPLYSKCLPMLFLSGWRLMLILATFCFLLILLALRSVSLHSKHSKCVKHHLVWIFSLQLVECVAHSGCEW